MVVGAKHGLKIKMINKKQTKINRKEYQKERFTKNKLNEENYKEVKLK